MLRFAPFESVAAGESSAKFTFVQCPKYFAVAEDEIFCWRMISAGMCERAGISRLAYME